MRRTGRCGSGVHGSEVEGWGVTRRRRMSFFKLSNLSFIQEESVHLPWGSFFQQKGRAEEELIADEDRDRGDETRAGWFARG